MRTALQHQVTLTGSMHLLMQELQRGKAGAGLGPAHPHLLI